MRYRTLGDSGLLVSVVGLGCNNFGGRLDAAQANAVVSAAIDEGITLLDTSDTYGKDGGSERALGEDARGLAFQPIAYPARHELGAAPHEKPPRLAENGRARPRRMDDLMLDAKIGNARTGRERNTRRSEVELASEPSGFRRGKAQPLAQRNAPGQDQFDRILDRVEAQREVARAPAPAHPQRKCASAHGEASDLAARRRAPERTRA